MSVSKKYLEKTLNDLNNRKVKLEGQIANLNQKIQSFNREYLMVIGAIESFKEVLGKIVAKEKSEVGLEETVD